MSINKLERNKNLIFYQIIAISLGFLATFLIIGTSLYSRLKLIKQSLFSKLETICGCANHLSFVNHPIIFTFLIVAGLLLLTFFCIAVIRILKIKKATGKFLKAVKARAKKQLSSKLKRAGKSAGLDGRIVEVEDEKPFVFCFGWRQPKVCVSSKLVKELNKVELTVVLLHEKQHLLANEPRKLFLIKASVKILFFVPGLRALAGKYVVFSEITADGLATSNWRNKKTLARALDKVIKLGEQPALTNNLAISFFTTIDERINKLTDDKYFPAYNFWMPKFLLSIFLLFFVVAAFVGFTRYGQPVMAHGSDSSACLLMPTESAEQCQMSVEVSECVMGYNLDIQTCG
jgi:beta-lactamase regulating signal transducer with metallopeptidase domain